MAYFTDSVPGSGPSNAEGLIQLVRLLARQAAREVHARDPEAPAVSANPSFPDSQE